MRKTQRRASAREWIRSGANVTIQTYTKRYGVDRYTAHDDLTALGVPLAHCGAAVGSATTTWSAPDERTSHQ